eukprot:g4305.t1
MFPPLQRLVRLNFLYRSFVRRTSPSRHLSSYQDENRNQGKFQSPSKSSSHSLLFREKRGLDLQGEIEGLLLTDNIDLFAMREAHNHAMALYVDAKTEGVSITPMTRLLLLENSKAMETTTLILNDMELSNDRLTGNEYHLALESCAIAGATTAAEELMQRMRDRGLRTVFHTYKLMVRTYTRARQPGKAFQFYMNLRKDGESHLHEGLMSMVISSANSFGSGTRKPDITAEEALGNAKFVFGEFLEHFGESETASRAPFNAVLGVASRAGDLDYVSEVFDLMLSRPEGGKPNGSSFEIFITQLMNTPTKEKKKLKKRKRTKQLMNNNTKDEEYFPNDSYVPPQSDRLATKTARMHKIVELFHQMFELQIPPSERSLYCVEFAAMNLKDQETLEKVELSRQILKDLLSDQSWRPDIDEEL